MISPFENNEAAWMFVSKDKEEALVAILKFFRMSIRLLKILKLKGLKS